MLQWSVFSFSTFAGIWIDRDQCHSLYSRRSRPFNRKSGCSTTGELSLVSVSEMFIIVLLQEVDIRLVNWEEGGYTVTDQQGPRGEIVVGGSHVAKEYYAMPEKTEEDFFNDNGKRWFR